MNFIFTSPQFPHTYWSFCDRLHRNGVNVLGIGDSLKADVEGAKNAGLAACWFCPGGFEKAPRPAPDHMVGDLRELYPIVMEEDELANVGSEHRKHQDLVGLPRP